MIVSFTLTRADVVRGSWVALRSRPLLLALAIVFFVVLPWAMAVWRIVDAARGADYVSTVSVIELVLIPPFAVVLFGAKPLWSSRGSRSIGGNFRFEFMDEDIHISGRGIDSRVQWSAVTKCFGTRYGVVLYSGNAPLTYLPGRGLAPETAAELRAMLAAKGVKVAGPWTRG